MIVRREYERRVERFGRIGRVQQEVFVVRLMRERTDGRSRFQKKESRDRELLVANFRANLNCPLRFSEEDRDETYFARFLDRRKLSSSIEWSPTSSNEWEIIIYDLRRGTRYLSIYLCRYIVNARFQSQIKLGGSVSSAFFPGKRGIINDAAFLPVSFKLKQSKPPSCLPAIVTKERANLV